MTSLGDGLHQASGIKHLAVQVHMHGGRAAYTLAPSDVFSFCLSYVRFPSRVYMYVRIVKLFTPSPSKEGIGKRGRACGAYSGAMEGS